VSSEPLPARSRAATIYDVASAAGVSHQTVSRLLRGYEGIRPETRERVERAIEELSYRPNLTARSLATRRSHRIGALTHELLQVGPSKIIEGASHGAREAGYLLDIVNLDPADPGAIDDAIRILGQNELAGIIGFAPTDAVVAAFERTGFAVPMKIDAEVDERGLGEPQTLNGRGELLLIEHLTGLGHRRFLHVGGPADWLSARNREAAYQRVLDRHGLTSVGTLFGDWSSESGYEAGRQIPLDGSVTAVVAGNDQMALGVMRALHERGASVPGDISVVGFDDIPEARYFHPALTTVGLDFHRQGRIAIARLIAEIDGLDAVVVPDPVDPRLQIRESSGPVAN
jgi:DNA-binding LacI/PurR family transcriptional regulator